MLKADTPVKKPWNKEVLQPSELRSEVKEARQALHDDMVARWVTDLPESRKRFYTIATICDPRQKGLRFSGINREQGHNWFEAEYIAYWAGDDPACNPRRQRSAPGPSNSDESRGHPQNAGASFLDFIKDLAQLDDGAEELQDPEIGEDGEGEEKLDNEVRKYLALPDVPMNVNILDWWAANELNFPNLSKMAQQFLGVPATSASAERLFSIAGRVFGDLRQSMDDENLESIMWARINRENRIAKMV